MIIDNLLLLNYIIPGNLGEMMAINNGRACRIVISIYFSSKN
jgi:hypothetical protein